MESGATAKLNGNAYTSGTTISAEGAYTIELSDRAGNSTTYTFTIDKTAPVVGSYDAYTNKGFTLRRLIIGIINCRRIPKRFPVFVTDGNPLRRVAGDIEHTRGPNTVGCFIAAKR